MQASLAGRSITSTDQFSSSAAALSDTLSYSNKMQRARGGSAAADAEVSRADQSETQSCCTGGSGRGCKPSDPLTVIDLAQPAAEQDMC